LVVINLDRPSVLRFCKALKQLKAMTGKTFCSSIL